MTPASLAHYAGHHGIQVFSIAVIVMLLLATSSWYFIQRYGSALQQLIICGVKRLLLAVDARLLRGRFATIEPGEYFVMHVLISFITLFVALAGFFELTEALAIDDELGQFDHELAQTLRSTIDDSTYRYFSIVTHLGDVKMLTALCIAVALFLVCRKQYLLLAGWLAAAIGNGLLTRTLKALFQRLRPLHDHGFADVEGWSFPSGHSSGAMVVYGMLAYLAIRNTDKRWHLPLVLLAIVLILLVGSSRIFLQVHYFTDVLAGFCSGAAWLAVCVAGTDIVLRQQDRARQFLDK